MLKADHDPWCLHPSPAGFFEGKGEKAPLPSSFSEASKVKVMTFSKVAYSFIENEQKLLKMIPCRVSYASKHKWCLLLTKRG